jgi:hypothetical protein
MAEMLPNKKAEVLSSAFSSTLVFLAQPKGPTIMLEG